MLDYLDIRECGLSSEALQPLFAAIGNSRSLRTLYCSGNVIDAECARDIVLPAVRRNTSLQTMVIDQPDILELVEVKARRR